VDRVAGGDGVDRRGRSGEHYTVALPLHGVGEGAGSGAGAVGADPRGAGSAVSRDDRREDVDGCLGRKAPMSREGDRDNLFGDDLLTAGM
jgi:hypothetical protein